METLISSISTALGWSLLHSLWQGAAIYLILFGLYLAIPGLRATTKHNLALAAQVTLFLCFVYTFFDLIDYRTTQESATPLSLKNEELFYIDYLHEKQSSIQYYFMYIVPLYLLGILVQSISCVRSYLQIKSLKRKTTDHIPTVWQEQFTRGIQRLGITKNVRLLLSDQIFEPLAMGFFRPVVIFPLAYINKMALAEVEALILHELAHIKRNDYLLNIMKIVMETILFFNPFIWLISRHIQTEREQACDDSVVSLLPQQINYAKALLTVELLKKETSSPRMSLAASGTQHKLLQRIKRITQAKMETSYTTIKHQLVASLMVLFTLVSVAWTQPNRKEEVKETTSLTTEVSSLINGLDTLTSQYSSTDWSADSLDNWTSDSVLSIDTNKINTKKFNSPEWKAHIAKIEENARKVEEKFNSPEWHAHIAKIEENARKVEEKFNSPEWHAHIAKIEENARKVEEKFNSPEWHAHIAKIEENARKVEEKFNSPEWHAHIAKIEENARKVEEKFNSPEWLAHIAKIEENARKVEEKFNSPEWLAHIAKIEENARKVEEKFNSPEWKNKFKKTTEQ
ncbi:M56 family metallopeptidase [Sphingobacterium tabacisoli]|uniref:M56 family metallopeptidase n=1 Tax=Sphingobacterium tabacisoli TaxID=2044855 RepID=A0ABW5KY35_9SPHI|nr:M56 family metallopeptidase [Sphingobacterium tabacisoli]